jgi:hypothetical protein
MNLTYRQTSFLDYLHDERVFVFYSSCPTIRRLYESEQMGGWSSSLLHLKDSGVLKFDDTLVLNDCMEWAIFRDGMAIAWACMVKRFLFLYLGHNTTSGLKRCWLIAEVYKDFP